MLWQLQIALDTLLYNNISHNNRLVPVYDKIPNDNSFPYIRYGNDTKVPDDTKTSYGGNITHTLHIFSQATSKREVKEITYLVEKALRQPLTFSGFSFWLSGVEFQEILEEDNDIKHMILRVRIRIQETE